MSKPPNENIMTPIRVILSFDIADIVAAFQAVAAETPNTKKQFAELCKAIRDLPSS